MQPVNIGQNTLYTQYDYETSSDEGDFDVPVRHYSSSAPQPATSSIDDRRGLIPGTIRYRGRVYSAPIFVGGAIVQYEYHNTSNTSLPVDVGPSVDDPPVVQTNGIQQATASAASSVYDEDEYQQQQVDKHEEEGDDWEAEVGIFHFSDDEGNVEEERKPEPQFDEKELRHQICKYRWFLLDTIQAAWDILPPLQMYFEACQYAANEMDPAADDNKLWASILVACGRFTQTTHVLYCNLSQSGGTSDGHIVPRQPRLDFVEPCHRFLVTWATLGMLLLKAGHLMDLTEESKRRLTNLHLRVREAKVLLQELIPGSAPAGFASTAAASHLDNEDPFANCTGYDEANQYLAD